MSDVSHLGLGCAPLGDLDSADADERADAVLRTALEVGMTWFDTAPLYGLGSSERHLGRVLRAHRRDDLVICTKVGRTIPSDGSTAGFDFSRDGVLRSIEGSLERLGLDRLDVVHVHDPDDHESAAMATAFPTLLDLREQGVIGRVGCGMNRVPMLQRLIERVDLDCVLLAGRWTLLDRTGAPLLHRCRELGIQVVLGGVFNSGVLADPRPGSRFDYGPAPDEVLRVARAMASVCADAGLDLAAVAVRFTVEHPAVATVLVGADRAEQVVDAHRSLTLQVPDEVWRALDECRGR